MKENSPGEDQKFACPNLSAKVLHRERLVKTLRDVTADKPLIDRSFQNKLTVVYAPAGYGKTTVIADFVQHAGFPGCWYILDETDNNKFLFLQRLIASMRYRFPQFDHTLRTLLESSTPVSEEDQWSEHAFEALTDNFIQAIENEIQEKFVLIFCNYHAVSAYLDIINLFIRLLQRLPQNCAMIIESRTIPAVELDAFILQQELFVLGKNKLAFTAQEVYDLAKLQQIAQLEKEDAENISGLFEGWITGILLGTYFSDIQFLSSGHKKSSEQRTVLTQRLNSQKLLKYITDEVFKLEPDLAIFLEETSIVAAMTPDLCNALLDISDAKFYLESLEQQGLFVSRNDTDNSYVFHPILRELFYDEIRVHNTHHFFELHCRAANFFQQYNDYQQAIFHAFEARAYGLTTEILTKISEYGLVKKYSTTIASRIDALPSSILEQYPYLLLVRGNIHIMHYEPDRAIEVLTLAFHKASASQVEGKAKKTLPAEILIAQSSAFFNIGEYGQAQSLSRQAIDLLPAEENKLFALAYQRLGLCAGVLGKNMSSITQLQHALQLWGPHTVSIQTASLHNQLAKNYNLIGNYALSEHHRRRAIDRWEQLGDMEGQINSLIGMGVMRLHQGIYSEAESYLNKALHLSREEKFMRGEAYALINLGELYQEQNNYKRALTVIEDGISLARRYQDSYLINYAFCSLAMIYLLMNDSQTALLLVSKVDLKKCETVSYEACFRELTIGTIFLYQQRYDEAYECLSQLENVTREAEWKRRQLQVTMRLAASQLGREQNTEAIHSVEKVATMLQQSKYEHLIWIEIAYQPALSKIIKTFPEPGMRESEVTSIPQHIQQKVSSIQINQPSLRTLALGIPTVLLENKPIRRWRLAKTMELYFFLLESQYPVHKEQIVDALWPHVDEQADQQFRSAVHYLRKAIGDACVVHHSGSYELTPTILYKDNFWYDVQEFRGLYAWGKSASAAENEQEAKDAFQKAIALYRGDYLQSFYNDWCYSRRTELRQQYLSAFENLAQIAWKMEQIDESIHYWQKLLNIDSYWEDAHHGIMRCYLRQGRRTLALRQYQQYEEILREVPATPGAAIHRLYQKLVQYGE